MVEEKVINGVLHWRGTPNGEWIPCTLENLSNKYLQSEYDRRQIVKNCFTIAEVERAFSMAVNTLLEEKND